HHHHRRPHRVRAPAPALPGHPARSRHPHQIIPRLPARRPPRGSRHHRRRRAARPRNHLHRHIRRRDRPPRVRIPSHRQRCTHHQPHPRRLSPQPAGPNLHHDQRIPSRHHQPTPPATRRWPRTCHGHGDPRRH